MHDPLRGDVLHALFASSEEPEASAEIMGDVERHQDRLKSNLQRIAQLPLDAEVGAAFTRVRPDLQAFAKRSEDVVRLAFTDRPAAVAQHEEVEESFERLAVAHGALTSRLAAAAQQAQDLAAEEERNAQSRVLMASAAALVGLVVLTFLLTVWAAT